ncbi:hypothetical protein V6N12_010505 [Hibiscus sabdariffa]|uniref:Uncharacterized protein n=1 Tax=Hibiscus sabdariffa TaxID=183260 RepID=A0ABR2EMN9_9ROSI
MPWRNSPQQQPSYWYDDQGDFYEDYSFDAATRMPCHENLHSMEAVKARMDARSLVIEETSRKVENQTKVILNIMNTMPRQLVQGDSEILNREDDGQIT